MEHIDRGGLPLLYGTQLIKERNALSLRPPLEGRTTPLPNHLSRTRRPLTLIFPLSTYLDLPLISYPSRLLQVFPEAFLPLPSTPGWSSFLLTTLEDSSSSSKKPPSIYHLLLAGLPSYLLPFTLYERITSTNTPLEMPSTSSPALPPEEAKVSIELGRKCVCKG